MGIDDSVHLHLHLHCIPYPMHGVSQSVTVPEYPKGIANVTRSYSQFSDWLHDLSRRSAPSAASAQGRLGKEEKRSSKGGWVGLAAGYLSLRFALPH